MGFSGWVVGLLLEIHGVNALWLFEGVGEDVVAGTGDGKNDIFRRDLQQTSINSSILPGKSINVLIAKLLVLLQLLIVVDTPMMLLIPSRRQRQTSRQIDDSGLICF